MALASVLAGLDSPDSPDGAQTSMEGVRPAPIDFHIYTLGFKKVIDKTRRLYSRHKGNVTHHQLQIG